MLWLVPAVVACFAGAWVLWARDLQLPGVLLALAGFALLFVLGRSIEAGRDQDWESVAARLQAKFRSHPPCADLGRFGAPAPWGEWARDGELQCQRAIEGTIDGVPYALVQVRYSVRERRGEEHPDSWYEVTVAALGRPNQGAGRALAPVAAPEGYTAVQNGQALFVWKNGSPGAGASLGATELPTLLEHARRAL